MDIDPSIAKQVAGPVGAVSAMVFMKGPLLQRLGMLVPGAALSYYGAGSLASYSGMPEGLAGFLLGLFGMTIIAKCFDTWETLQLGELIQQLLRKWFGVGQ